MSFLKIVPNSKTLLLFSSIMKKNQSSSSLRGTEVDYRYNRTRSHRSVAEGTKFKKKLYQISLWCGIPVGLYHGTGTVPGTSSLKDTPAIYLGTFIEIMKQKP